jgi:hypothetical protein
LGIYFVIYCAIRNVDKEMGWVSLEVALFLSVGLVTNDVQESAYREVAMSFLPTIE